MPIRNLMIFVLAAALLITGYVYMRSRYSPEVGPVGDSKEAKAKAPAAKKDDGTPAAAYKLPPLPRPTAEGDLEGLTLGDRAGSSRFNLFVQLDPLAGGVRSVILNKFQSADVTGQPGDGPLELVPASANSREPAFALYHFLPGDTAEAAVPLDTLGQRRWEAVKQTRDEVNGKARHTVAFKAELAEHGLTIRKVYTLVEGEYHVGLRVEMERAALKPGVKAAAPAELFFRYQLAGAKGLPIEGRWYTGTFRNALIGVEDGRGGLVRDLQESRQISLWDGGNAVERGDDRLIRYAGPAVQYFAAMLVVDDDQPNQAFLRRARPTLETGVIHGRIKGGSGNITDRIVLTDGKRETTIYLPPHLQRPSGASPWPEGTAIAVIFRTLSYDEELKAAPKLAVDIRTGSDAEATHGVWYDDLTVRVNTEAVALRPGETAAHKYLLYHGPVKPSLLGGLRGEEAVDRQLVDHYAYGLKLNTMTDYQSVGWMGSFARTIGWTWLVIKTTNLMHVVLNFLQAFSGYGLSIILLTVMVRTLLFPLSRKQAIMSLRMQELAPEMRKIKEQYKDDHQGASLAQMALFKKHGVNPFGSCWVILLQMPIFMGLYFALQESITFRLAPFWPTWIDNLAAPDMMINWGRNIPWLSRDQDFGGFLYLGPYLNLLPIIAVALMIVQQKMMTPPAADEQQEMQQKMMTYMMIFFGLMFYKVAAGLCVYFIASSLWGFAERKLLPKAKLAPVGVDLGAAAPAADGAAPGSTAVTSKDTSLRKGKGRKKGGGGKAGGEVAKKEEEPTTWLGRLRKRMRDRLNEVLEEAKKKKPGERGAG